jgi:hypothetical protein
MIEIEFDAANVVIQEIAYTGDYSVLGMYFRDRMGTEDWNYTRAICDEEIQRVCTVKEIQQFVLDGHIELFQLSGDEIYCVFQDAALIKTKYIKSVKIHFNLPEVRIMEMRRCAVRIFENEKCLKCMI